MSEADSIFDEVHTLGTTKGAEFVLKRNSNQASDKTGDNQLVDNADELKDDQTPQ